MEIGDKFELLRGNFHDQFFESNSDDGQQGRNDQPNAVI